MCPLLPLCCLPAVCRVYRNAGMLREARILLRHAVFHYLATPLSTTTATNSVIADAEHDTAAGAALPTAASGAGSSGTDRDEKSTAPVSASTTKSAPESVRVDDQGCVCGGGQYVKLQQPAIKQLMAVCNFNAPLPLPELNVRCDVPPLSITLLI